MIDLNKSTDNQSMAKTDTSDAQKRFKRFQNEIHLQDGDILSEDFFRAQISRSKL